MISRAIDAFPSKGYDVVTEIGRSGGEGMPFTRGIGVPELVIILVIVMIIFGVGRLPEVGGALGKAIREFRKSQTDSSDFASEPETEEKEKSLT